LSYWVLYSSTGTILRARSEFERIRRILLDMNVRRFQLSALFIIATLVVAACSSGGASDSTTTTAPAETITTLPPVTTTTSPTSTTTSSTTTTEPPTEVSASINGLPAADELIDRRVVAIKIDNHVKARPQSALQIADAVFEIPVEGGITRFIAMFHQSDLDWVGPNRSGRPTDSELMASFEESPFQISGAQPWVLNVFRSDRVKIVTDTGATTFRYSGRSAPHNLFTSTLLIREWADDRGWSDENLGNLFRYGEPTPSDPGATTVRVAFSDAPIPTWEWDGSEYLRYHGSVPHEWFDDDGNTGQVAFDTIVVMQMRKYTKSDPAGQGSSVPAMDTIGTGDAFVFFDGGVVEGTWERTSKTERFLLTTPDGDEIILPPGRVWIAFQPNNQPLTWE